MSVAVHDLLFWGAVALCAVAQLFILKAVFFPAPLPVDGPAADGRAAGRLRPASRPLEMAWVVLPAIGLGLVFWWAWDTRHPVSLRSGATSAQHTAAMRVDLDIDRLKSETDTFSKLGYLKHERFA